MFDRLKESGRFAPRALNRRFRRRSSYKLSPRIGVGNLVVAVKVILADQAAVLLNPSISIEIGTENREESFSLRRPEHDPSGWKGR